MGIIEKMRLDEKNNCDRGSKGIGKSVAIAFAEAGADITIVDLNIDEAEKTTTELKNNNGIQSIAVQADVSKPGEVNSMMNKVLGEFGYLNVAFCNAGICINTPVKEMTFKEREKVIDVTLISVFLTAQAAGKVMIEGGGGSIINMASMSGHNVNIPQLQCAYNASKAGVIQLTKSLAVEWATKNVRINWHRFNEWGNRKNYNPSAFILLMIRAVLQRGRIL